MVQIKNRYNSIAFCLCFKIGLLLALNEASAQTLSPRVLPSTGGYVSAAGTSLSFTVGEPATATLQNGNVMLTQGQQQPYILLKLLNLKAFIEGLYIGGGQMQAALYNNFPGDFSSTDCDSVFIELRDPMSPSTLIAGSYGILQTDGNAEVKFPASLNNGAYYIVLRHRNSVETWSKVPVTFGAVTNFDFTTN